MLLAVHGKARGLRRLGVEGVGRHGAILAEDLPALDGVTRATLEAHINRGLLGAAITVDGSKRRTRSANWWARPPAPGVLGRGGRDRRGRGCWAPPRLLAPFDPLIWYRPRSVERRQR